MLKLTASQADLFAPLEPYADHSLCDVAKREVLAVLANEGADAAMRRVSIIADAFEDMALIEELRQK